MLCPTENLAKTSKSILKSVCLGTPYSDIPEGCVLVDPRNARSFVFSDCTLTVTHAMYLVSNKVASNDATITVFLHTYIVLTIIYVHVIHHRQNLNFSKLFRLEDGKSVKYLANRSEGVQYNPECQGFYTFFSVFMLYRMLATSIPPPKMTHFSLNIPW